MLYRMGKYAGLPAMRGMLPRNSPWVRPLLVLRRRDTEEFCRQRGIEFAVDRGNSYPGYARTGIRREVVPAWERALPGAVESAARTAEVVAEIESLVDHVLGSLGVETGASTMDVGRLLFLPMPARRLLLHKWLEQHGLRDASRSQVLAVESLLHRGGSSSVSLGSSNNVVKEYDRLTLVKEPLERSCRMADRAESSEEVALPLPGAAEWMRARISAEQVRAFLAPDPAREAYLDAAAVGGPLTVRAPLPGDRIHPLGASGSRKLQDVLVDLRIPATKRHLVPLVVCDGDILWVCGSVSSEKGRIRNDTKEIIKFSVDFPTSA
jgi:tRNA(Ile)-lysidine synthase